MRRINEKNSYAREILKERHARPALSRSAERIVSPGIPMLLTAFLTVALAVFAAGTLASANANHSTSVRLAAQKEAWYQASSAAEELVAAIDAEADKAKKENGAYTKEEYLLDARRVIEDAGITAVCDTENTAVLFTIPVSEDNELSVRLVFTDSEDNGADYTIAAWESVNTSQWTGTQTITLFEP